MRVHIGGDHAAYDMKLDLVAFLQAQGHDVVDHGPATYDPDDDYPVAVLRAARAVAADPSSRGVVLGGSGNGEQIAANKVPGIRAALAHSVETATLGRLHNDAHVVAIGARMNTVEQARAMVAAFLETRFSEDPRHVRRLAQIEQFVADGTLPGED